MEKIKKGDIVGRKSYGKDILFVVTKIIKTRNGDSIAILKGLTIRIEADSPVSDLERANAIVVHNNLRTLDSKLQNRIHQCSPISTPCMASLKMPFPGSNRSEKIIYTGKILHLDGDKKYSDKSAKHYKNLGLNAIIKNIAENKQPSMIESLLNRYKPDILVLTGHDGMIKNGTDYNNIYNYRNSKYFISSVKIARKWAVTHHKDLVIFAGACQSYFEAIMSAGANFASSPARVLIDFADPLIIAEKIATTDKNKYITISDVASELRDGTKGIGGTGAMGKKQVMSFS